MGVSESWNFNKELDVKPESNQRKMACNFANTSKTGTTLPEATLTPVSPEPGLSWSNCSQNFSPPVPGHLPSPGSPSKF